MFKEKIGCLVLCASVLTAVTSGCADKNEVAMTVDGRPVYVDFYNYLMAAGRSYYETNFSDSEDIDSMLDDLAESYAKDQAIFQSTVVNLCNEYGLTLDDSDKELLRQNKKENIASAGGTANWQNSLIEAGSSVKIYDQIAEISVLYQKLYNYKTLEYFKENYITAEHILKSTLDSNKNKLSKQEIEQKKQEITNLLEQAKAGADFSTLVAENTEDSGFITHPNGYTFKQGDVVEEFYNTALSLEENEISDIVESAYGFHIIKRLPLNMQYFEDNNSTLLSDYEEDFQQFIDDKMKEANVEYISISDSAENTQDTDAESDNIAENNDSIEESFD